MIIRKADILDVTQMVDIIDTFASQGVMLKRSKDELIEHIRDYFVSEIDHIVTGTISLHIDTKDYAELRSLAVLPEYQNNGIGKELIKSCIKEAAGLNIRFIYTLTYLPGIFKKFDFKIIDKKKLPQKIWKDCVRCIKFPSCDEIAMIKEV